MDLITINKAGNMYCGRADADVVKLGGKVVTHMETIKKVVGVCKKS